jgi:CRP-like cAMP-binding protein
MHASHGRKRSLCAPCTTRPACLTSHLDAGELAAVESSIVRWHAMRGDELASEGELATCVRVIGAGSAFAYHRGIDGASRPIGMAGRGAAFGVFGVFGQRTPVSFAAAGDARICEIPVRVLVGVAETNPAFARYLASSAVELCGVIAAWSAAMRVRGSTNQLAYALVLLSDAQDSDSIELPSHVALADLLGARRETVARGLGVLEEEGCIERSGGKRCAIRRERLLQRLGDEAG